MTHVEAAHDQACALAGVAGMQQLARGVAIREREQRTVVAVDGVGPGGDSATRGDLEHVGREASVGERQIERGGAPITLEVEIGGLGELRSWSVRGGGSARCERR